MTLEPGDTTGREGLEPTPADQRAIVVVLDRARRARRAEAGSADDRPLETRVAEAVGLAEAISLVVVASPVVPIRRERASTLIGEGKVAEIGELVTTLGAGLVIVDGQLTPVQQRDLEKAWQAKVLDRTGIILEIFGERAQTREGRLQVDLARLNYQKGRLVRQWTHLERQRGGLGKTGGPGETQIEADRRAIQQKILRLESELEDVRRTRALHRAGRARRSVPTVALVGYTNAGKSTLFNKLSHADVDARDMLFATLDPTHRELILPDDSRCMLVDTVGFISDLPTTLVAAFRATLEEVVDADLLVHVHDAADPDRDAKAEAVRATLRSIGVDSEMPVLEVWNKVDLIASSDGSTVPVGQGAIAVSAHTGEGVDGLVERIQAATSDRSRAMTIRLPAADLALLAVAYGNCKVLGQRHNEDGSVDLDLTCGRAFYEKFLPFAQA